MVHFSQEINCKYGVKTYQDVKNTYDWIVKAAESMNLPSLKIKSEFFITIGTVNCKCDSIEDLISHGYGASKFKLLSFDIYVYSEKSKIFSAHYLGNLSIITDRKNDLEKVVNALESTSLSGSERCDRETKISAKNSVVIVGDGNLVNKEHGMKQFFTGIVQGIMSNLVWFLLTIAVTAIVTYFATH